MAKIDTRDKLLQAGLEMLHRQGFNATGVQEITEAAGVPKGSFYNHFESKDLLAVEIVKAYAARNAEKRKQLVEGAGAPLVRLRRYFESLNQIGEATKFSRGCLLGNFATELSAQSEAVRAGVRTAFEEWTTLVASVITEAQRDGTVARDVPARTLAAFLINAWEGAVIRSKVEKSGAPLDGFMSITFKKILT